MIQNWKTWSRTGLVLAALLPAAAQANNPDLIGDWVRANGTVKIAVTQCGADFCVVNTWVKRPEGREKKGDKLVLTMQPVSATEYKGEAYDVKRHLTYRMTITFDGNSMQTSGCVLLGIVCKSTSWTKID